MSLTDLFSFVRNMSNGKEVLHGEEERLYSNPIVDKGFRSGGLALEKSGDAKYSYTNQLGIHDIVHDAGRLMYDIRASESEVGTG